MEEVERLTGMRVGLYELNPFLADSPRLSLPSPHRFHTSPVCERMKRCAAGLRRCVETENWKTREAARHPDGFVHTCYAGVTDFVIPIRVRDRHAGILFLGQAVAREGCPAAAARTCGVPAATLRRDYAAMPRASAASLREMGRLLGVARGFIEQLEELAALGPEYRLSLEYGAKSAREAIRLGKVPFRRLRELRSRLEGEETRPIRQALDAIEKGYARDLSHGDVARLVGLSPSHFSRKFRLLTGRTFRHVALETRLSVGFFLIRKYHATLGEAADLVGYADDISFRRAFRKVAGLSVKEFQRRYPRAFDLVEG